LSVFEATPLTDGRSVLVSWTLEYSGGPDTPQLVIEVKVLPGTNYNAKVDVVKFVVNYSS